MAKSKITVQFVATPTVDEDLVFSSNQSADNILEIFSSVRSYNNESKIGYNNIISANNYYDALVADYGGSGLYVFTLNLNLVTIEATQSNVIFSLLNNTASATTVVIDNETEDEPISISSTTISSYLPDIANRVKVNVLTNVLATSYDDGDVLGISNSSNPFNYSILRGSTRLLKVYDSNGNTATKSIIAPAILASANIVTNIVNTPSGANVTVSVSNSNLLVLQYSLDGSTWQSSNIFNGILIGNYTMYVKDQFGYIVNKNFSVTSFEPNVSATDEYSYLSKAMSIRYKKNETWDYNDIHKNFDNTLSCEEQVDNAYKYKQKFKPINVVKTQFLSNYTNISANVIKEDGTKDSLVIDKKINFLDIKDKRDARIYSISSTETGLYYTSGNTYDYATGVDNGDYALNGALPDYGVIGNYVMFLADGWFLIKDIIYNEALNADVLVLDMHYVGPDVIRVVSAKYNQCNFNVYEFTVDFSKYNNSEVQIEILQSAPTLGFNDYNYLSEVLEVKDYYPSCVEIKWVNEEDTLIFYSTGIHNVGNFEFLTFNLGKDSSLEIHKTPYSAVVIDSSNYELRELTIDEVSTEIANQLIQASLHKNLCINGIRYISHSEPEISVVDFTNIHQVKLTLLRVPTATNYSASL